MCQCLNKTWFILLGRNLCLATCISENYFFSWFGTRFSEVLSLWKGVLSTLHPAEVQGGVNSLSTSMIRHFVTVLKLFYQKELLFSWHLLHVSLSVLCRLFLPSFCNTRKFDPGVMVTNPFKPRHCSFSYHEKLSVELQLSIILVLFFIFYDTWAWKPKCTLLLRNIEDGFLIKISLKKGVKRGGNT